MAKKHPRRNANRRPLAERADRHRLYELSVQSPESEVDFVSRWFRKHTGRRARLLREDFCGTAAVCCEWVRRHRDNEAVGVDLDPQALDWARVHHVAELKSGQRSRLTLLQDDVLKVTAQGMDIVLAMNFSYWLFRERRTLRRYFSRVHKALAPDGIFFLDAFGGYDAFRELQEEREIDDGDRGFTYVWDQAEFNPVDNRMRCHIHFAFPDGSRIDRAFSYEWRLWTLPEIRDLLEECGFRNITAYWQGFDENGEADGRFRPAVKADADAGWICYLTAEKA
jgi:SAM-dependent methyltransferase